MKLKDKVALVTGGAQGIGKAIALALAAEGAKIVLTDVNLELAEQTATEIRKMGAEAKALKSNVADPKEAEESINAAKEAFGSLDVLVNNAGITRDTLLIRMKQEDWDTVISVNLTGVFNMARAAATVMMKQRSGKIINIASIVGQMGNAGQVNYSASKAGVIGMTKTISKELAPRGITVNAIAPGFIETAMTQKLPEEVRQKMLAQIPLAKFGRPEDIAKTVVFLASSDADYITGQVIAVNGGMYM